jgi:hypothetical protein
MRGFELADAQRGIGQYAANPFLGQFLPLMHPAQRKHNGFMLVAEMVAILILAITLVGLARINRITLTGSNQMIFAVHASWMIEDIFTRMRINETDRLANNYSRDQFSVICPGVGDPFEQYDLVLRDLQQVFCSPNQAVGGNKNVFWGSAAHIAGLEWSITCVGGAPGNCPEDAPINVTLSWPNRATENVMGDGRERLVRQRSFM